MKTLKKLIPVLLSLVFVVSSVMTITAFAATSNQDGLDATLSFAKTEYAANEDIATTLTVKNNNSYTVKDIQTEITLPDGISLKSGNLTQEKFDLTANDSKVQELTLTKIVQATEPSTDNTDNSQTDTPSDDTNSPQTGDNSHIGIFVILMILSGGALVVIGIKQKKLHINGMMSIVLCFALVGAMLPMTAFAASKQKNFTVEETVKVDGKDTTVKATVSYEFVQYNNVTVTNGTGTGLYIEGETVTITADEAPEGKHFVGWTVEKGNVTLADSNNAATTFVMGKEEVEIKTNYEVNKYTISSFANGGGGAPGDATVNYGDSKTFTFVPFTGYHVADVKVDDVSVGAKTSYEFKNVTANHKIEVSFAIDTFTITATANAGGTITETATVNYGDSKTFTITPNADYHIEKVEIDEENKGAINTYTFTDVKEAHTIKVTFAINPYTITATAGANGSITESAKLNTGDSKTFTMTANSGYGVKDVKVDGTSVGPVTSYTFENVNGNHTIEVVFDKATTVSTAQDFRDAVKQDGIIILANDITLDDNGDVEIDKNVIIHGSGHIVYLPVYSGSSWSRPVAVKVVGNANVEIESCSFLDKDGKVPFCVSQKASVSFFGGIISRLMAEDDANLTIKNSVINNNLDFMSGAVLTIHSGEIYLERKSSWAEKVNNESWEGQLNVLGGTYNFDVSPYLNTNIYKATQTKDSDGVDIWVVTAK